MEIKEAKQLMIESAVGISRDDEEISVLKCIGRVIAEDIVAPFSVPSFPKSAMDGYAVNSVDIRGATREKPVGLEVAGEMLAGDYKEIEYVPGRAVRIMTGAFVPQGYDAIVKQEDTDYGEDRVCVYKPVKAFANYCKVGEDIMMGETVIKANTVLTRAHVGMLASLGIVSVKVKQKPTVGILCTGSELLAPGDRPVPGKIFNSISYMLAASLEERGISYKTVICEDEVNAITENILNFLDSCDVVITTGGVSVGKKDLLPQVINQIGATQLFKRVNIKPGTPTTASVREGKIILSLSGNPYAALCNFDYYFWDLIAHIADDENWKNKVVTAVLQDSYPKKENTKRFLRARIEDGVVSLEKVNASSVISNLNQCNSYVIIDANREYKKGDEVMVLKIK